MSDEKGLPTSFIDPATERAERVERSLYHVAKAVELELADIALQAGSLDDLTKERLHKLGGVFLRLSTCGLAIANSVSDVMDGERFTIVTQNGQHAEPPFPPEQVTASPITTDKPMVSSEKSQSLRGNQVSNEPQPIENVSEQTHLPTSEATVPEGARKQRSHEKKQFEGEWYQAIISPDKTPVMELREGMEPINIAIVSDDTIDIDGTKLRLEGDKKFIFSAIMSLRDQFVAAKDIRALGFAPRSSNTATTQAFSMHMGALSSELKQAAGVEIIKRIGEKAQTRYAVNPAVVLSDERSSVELREPSESVKKNG